MNKLKSIPTKIRSILQPKNVYESHWPLIFSLCCGGLLPFKVAEQSLKRSKWCYCVAVMNHIVFAYAFAQTLIQNTSFIECFFQTEISKVGNTLHFAVSFISMIIVYASCFCQRNKIKTVLDRQYALDSKLKVFLLEPNHSRGFRFGCVAITILWTLYVSFTFGGILMVLHSNKKFKIYSWVSYFLPNLMVNLVIFMFTCVLNQIKTRYDRMNEILRNLCGSESTKSFNVTISPLKSFKQSQDSSSNLLAERKLVEVVKDVCGIHDDLSDTCLLAEEYFALKMLTIVGIGFLIIVFNLYYVMEIAFGQIPDEFQEESYKFLIFLVFQVAMNILGILCIIQSSCAISNENRNCSIYVHKLMNTTTDDIAKEKLLQFSLQLIHRKVKFTALNLFPLDRTLIFTIAGAATTYLIILFQFSNQNRFPNVKT
ncbi:putative gustatory receptor 28b isoform X3 [Bradysia coprophila]|uniref:putative gustatory receptor 28b isoform X3 n=1 Tax=Bradysia coprophila TaxID=38358 RepID=UPI00187DABB0|nr:putative gustatory receptor 28b isoform X3 [Bradysia coprophila]